MENRKYLNNNNLAWLLAIAGVVLVYMDWWVYGAVGINTLGYFGESLVFCGALLSCKEYYKNKYKTK